MEEIQKKGKKIIKADLLIPEDPAYCPAEETSGKEWREYTIEEMEALIIRLRFVERDILEWLQKWKSSSRATLKYKLNRL